MAKKQIIKSTQQEIMNFLEKRIQRHNKNGSSKLSGELTEVKNFIQMVYGKAM